jgi:hypothetical protein
MAGLIGSRGRISMTDVSKWMALSSVLFCAVVGGCGDDNPSDSGADGSGESDVRDGADSADASSDGTTDDASASDAASDATGAVDAEEVEFGLFGGCSLGVGAEVFVLGQSPTRLYGIGNLTCALRVAEQTYDEAALDFEQDGVNAYFSTESQVVAAELVGLEQTAAIDQDRAVLAHGLGQLLTASESGPILGVTANLEELTRSEDTEFIELIGCIDLETSGPDIYGLCGWNANSETYAGVLQFAGEPMLPSILFTAAPGSLPRSIAVVDSTVYLLEATQPALYAITSGADPVVTDLSGTFPVSDGFSSLSGEIYAFGGEIWLTTIGDERGQLYMLSLGLFVGTGDPGQGIPAFDIVDLSQVGTLSKVVAVTPWVEDLDDGRRVEGMQVLELAIGTGQVQGRAVFNGIFPTHVR